jgi:hypothetical protein
MPCRPLAGLLRWNGQPSPYDDITIHASRAGSATPSGSALFAPGHPEWIVDGGKRPPPRPGKPMLPAACHVTEQYMNNPNEADHGRLKSRLLPIPAGSRCAPDWLPRRAAELGPCKKFFTEHDMLITPMLATLAPKAQHWSRKGRDHQCPAGSSAHRLWRPVGPRRLSSHVHPGWPPSIRTYHRHSACRAPDLEARLVALAAQLDSVNPRPKTAPTY